MFLLLLAAAQVGAAHTPTTPGAIVAAAPMTGWEVVRKIGVTTSYVGPPESLGGIARVWTRIDTPGDQLPGSMAAQFEVDCTKGLVRQVRYEMFMRPNMIDVVRIGADTGAWRPPTRGVFDPGAIAQQRACRRSTE